MPIRTADAEWKGTLKDGKGTVRLGSKAFEGPYSFSSRFENGTGTNPEELVGAAHAGCYSMALSAGLSAAGYTPTRLHTTAKVHIDKVGDGFEITKIELDTEGQVPNITPEKFREFAEQTKLGCPVSKALAGTKILLNVKLLS